MSPDRTRTDETAADAGGTAAEEQLELPAVPATELRPALEALLMVADEPMDEVTLAAAVGHPTAEVGAALHALAGEYDEQGRGFELRSVGGGWRYYTRETFAAVLERFVLDGQQARLTQAALETLAVVAYQQPVSRARVSAVRGVNVDGVVRTLLARGLLEEAGVDEVSGAHLYATTGYFLERVGIRSLDELPELAPYLPELGDLEDDLGASGGASDPTAAARGGTADAEQEALLTETPAGAADEPGPRAAPGGAR